VAGGWWLVAGKRILLLENDFAKIIERSAAEKQSLAASH